MSDRKKGRPSMFDRKMIGRRIQEILDKAVAKGDERGVQAAAYLDGELIVDAWAGIADAATGRKVDGRTLFPVYSTTKGIASIAVRARRPNSPALIASSGSTAATR